MIHARARQEAFRDAPVRAGVVVTKEGKKREKMKNKTSIKYMRGPWRGGNLPFIPCKKKGKENTRRTSSTAFRDVRRHPVVSKRGKKETIHLRDARYKNMYYIYICVKNMIIYIYIYIIHVYAVRSRFSSERSILNISCKTSSLRASSLLSFCAVENPIQPFCFSPPSLPPTRGELAGPPHIAIFVLFHVETSIYNKLY